jgi:hypothetical protein
MYVQVDLVVLTNSSLYLCNLPQSLFTTDWSARFPKIAHDQSAKIYVLWAGRGWGKFRVTATSSSPERTDVLQSVGGAHSFSRTDTMH